jgi:hypothetical protein
MYELIEVSTFSKNNIKHIFQHSDFGMGVFQSELYHAAIVPSQYPIQLYIYPNMQPLITAKKSNESGNEWGARIGLKILGEWELPTTNINQHLCLHPRSATTSDTIASKHL